jgi:hypothetical protein
MGVEEMAFDGEDCIHLAQDTVHFQAVVNTPIILGFIKEEECTDQLINC